MVQVIALDCQMAVLPLPLTKGRLAKVPLRPALGRADELDPQ